MVENKLKLPLSGEFKSLFPKSTLNSRPEIESPNGAPCQISPVAENQHKDGKFFSKKFLNKETGRWNQMHICGFKNCWIQFDKQSNMVDHIRTHSGVKPHFCQRCNVSFKQKGQLTKHLKTSRHLRGGLLS
jgi:hypothetical protein